MKSLFIRIFISVWIILTVVGSAIFATALITQSGPFGKGHARQMADTLDFFGRTAVRLYEKGGAEAVAEYAGTLEQSAHIKAYLLDGSGNMLPNGRLQADVKDLALRASKSGAVQELHGEDRFWIANPIGRIGHGKYVVVGQFIPPLKGPLGIIFFDPKVMGERLIESVIVSGVISYFIALYLTAPIRRLRTAAQKLGGGDLSARVGPEIGKRKDEIGELGRDFNVMAGRLEELLESQARLLRDISHELRSPLARLNVALGLARKRSSPEADKSLDRIEQESERLNELIGQLLTLTQLESGAERLRKAPVDLAALVGDVVHDADFEAGSRNRSVIITSSDKVTVVGSEEFLRRAIENVIRNAVRYTSEGSAVEVGLEQDGVFVIVKVRDHGPGVFGEELTNIFKPFYRTSDARDRESGGTGIGLAITERAIRLHDGEISASNADKGGLIIEIRLPLKEG